MEEKLSGIVLGGVSFGENDKILNIFTLEQGVVSAKIKGVKKAGAKLKFASEPFCFAEFIFSKRNNMRTVIGASLIDSFYPVREDIVKFFCAGTVVEFIKKFYKEDMVSSQIFLNAVKALENIAYGENNPKSHLINFLILALKDSGIQLSVNGCFYCGCEEIVGRVFFDYRTGSFCCENCFDGTGREVNNNTLTALCLAGKGLLDDSFDGTDKALRLIDYYIKNRAEESLNSLSELIKMFK